jgi:hypothetical protein
VRIRGLSKLPFLICLADANTRASRSVSLIRRSSGRDRALCGGGGAWAADWVLSLSRCRWSAGGGESENDKTNAVRARSTRRRRAEE